jgi:hypothetical protein
MILWVLGGVVIIEPLPVWPDRPLSGRPKIATSL